MEKALRWWCGEEEESWVLWADAMDDDFKMPGAGNVPM